MVEESGSVASVAVTNDKRKWTTPVPVLWNGRGPGALLQASAVLGHFLALTIVVGRHRTFGPASEPRKGCDKQR